MDGGVHSVTNIDVLPFDRLDEVWVIAPMAGAVFQHFGTGGMRNGGRSSSSVRPLRP